MGINLGPNSYPDQSVGQLVKAALQANIGGGGGFAPGYVYVAVPAGETDNLTPPNFPGSQLLPLTRLDIDPSVGNANVTGLIAGFDGQMAFIFNASTENILTLNNGHSGSLAANQFQGAGDFELPAMTGILAIYYAGTIKRWRFIP